MRRIVAIVLCAVLSTAMYAQKSMRVEVPGVVGVDEQFNVTFIIEDSGRPSSFSWNQGSDFQLVWGPQQGSSTSVQIINGKKSRSSQFTYTYVLSPVRTGKFELPSATATIGGKTVSSSPVTVEVVSNGSSSSSSSGSSSSSSSDAGGSSQSYGGDIASGDLFMRLVLSRTDVVVGEPITATLKLYQRVDIAGFEDARFPTFDGFWSQETSAPSNIQFRRETLDDKIYEAAVLRSYTLIPQKAGDLRIDPAELVCLVNLRTKRTSTSIFDDFFDGGYRTVRKRVSSPAVNVHVRQLPSGAPASFGGGVGRFSIEARLSKDTLSTNDAASLILTVSGTGNVSLLEAPVVHLHPDMEVYDVKTTDNTDRARGGVSGSKTFEYPFIPRSAGEFTIDLVEYSYYDVTSGKYVTLKTTPLTYFVKQSKSSSSASSSSGLQSVDRRGVKTLGEDIRYIDVRKPDFRGGTRFLVGRPLYWILLLLVAVAAVAAWLVLRKVAAGKADVAGTKNRKATRMALKRLKLAGEYLERNLGGAFYEELHKALLGFASDKLNMGMEELNKDKMAERFKDAGAPQDEIDKFISLIDACEYARYSPEGGNEAMAAHYSDALEVISSIDASMKTKNTHVKGGAVALVLLLAFPCLSGAVQSYPDSLWNRGVQAYENGRWDIAASAWDSLIDAGVSDSRLYYNAGNAWFKAGDYPQAILHYERAVKADPSDSDARYNLEFAKTMIQDRIDAVPEFIFKSWMRKLNYTLSSDSWAVISLMLFAAALALALLFFLARRPGSKRVGFYGGIVALLFAVLSFSFAKWQLTDYDKADSAIVMKPVSSVKSSPSSTSATDLFVLHGGTKVRIMDSVGEWDNISLEDGRQGWIKTSDIEVI